MVAVNHRKSRTLPRIKLCVFALGRRRPRTNTFWYLSRNTCRSYRFLDFWRSNNDHIFSVFTKLFTAIITKPTTTKISRIDCIQPPFFKKITCNSLGKLSPNIKNRASWVAVLNPLQSNSAKQATLVVLALAQEMINSRLLKLASHGNFPSQYLANTSNSRKLLLLKSMSGSNSKFFLCNAVICQSRKLARKNP